MALVVTAFIVFMERAQRRLLIQYPKRQVGNRMFEGQSSHLPLKLNTSGVIPPIFASSLLLLPTTVANFNAGPGPEWFQTLVTQLSHGRPLFLILYIGMIVFFAFFYTAIVFNPTETADNLKKHGGFIPGIRPGERTAEYIDYVLTRITAIGAVYLSLVCLLPEIILSYAPGMFYFGGTSLLIVVSVTMDTVAQVQGHLLAHQYEGLIKKSKLRGGGDDVRPPRPQPGVTPRALRRMASMSSGLGRRIGLTIGALLVVRLGTFISIPGINPQIWQQIFRQQSGGILGAVDLLAGGGIGRLSIFALEHRALCQRVAADAARIDRVAEAAGVAEARRKRPPQT